MSQLEAMPNIDTLFLFMPGNQLFPSLNFKDRDGNQHAHIVRKKRFKNKQVESEMAKYAPILSLCKVKKISKIIVVTCYLRNIYRPCSATYNYCKARNLREAFPLAYSKRIISLAMRKLTKLIAAEDIRYETIPLKKFEYICLGQQVKNLSQRQIISHILGDDDVHLCPGPQRLLGQHLSHSVGRGSSTTARFVGGC